MRTTHFTTLLILLLGVLAGCGRVPYSGIPTALNSDKPLLMAGSSQGIMLGGQNSSSHSGMIERRFRATISSGTSGQLLAAYRRAVERTITSMGGEIHGEGVSGNPDDVEDFSYAYTWGGTDGIVSVHSFVGTNGEVQVVLVCYEHRR